MAEETCVNVGPIHNIRIRRPHIKKEDFQTKYGGYVTFAATVLATLFCTFSVERVLFMATKFHAHLGDGEAQHLLGQHYLQGHGTKKDTKKAMDWFQKASIKGHPHAAYNLGLGHVQKLHSLLKKGEAEKFISSAADAGVKEAKYAIKYLCSDGFCKI